MRLLLADGDRIVGYKVGLTSKPMQKMIGVDQPDYGPVLGSTVYADGDARQARRRAGENGAVRKRILDGSAARVVEGMVVPCG